MSRKIETGSLVCMGRRKVKGQGLVLDRVKDINDFAEFDLSDAWLVIYDKTHPNYYFKDSEKHSSMLWTLRADLRDSIIQNIRDSKHRVSKELLKEFWGYNAAHSYLKNGNKILTPKTDFSLVRWAKAPSDYSDKPCKWYHKKTCWHHTKMLKSL